MLKRSTLALSSPHSFGTGTFVAPGLVLTCAHVVSDSREPPSTRLTAQWRRAPSELEPLDLEVVPEWYRPGHDGGPDLALLRLSSSLHHPYASLIANVQPGDDLYAYGYPEGPYRAGDSLGFEYQGTSERMDGQTLLRVTEDRATEGFSGGPALNWRTGGVCGVLRLSLYTPGVPPVARLIPAATILSQFPFLADTPGSPGRNRAWLDQLTDEQVYEGRLRYPGPRLRSYLRMVQQTVTRNPYRLSLQNAPPLDEVYLRQQATPEPMELVNTDEILASNRHALVIGGPGMGKSSLLRRLAYEAADQWISEGNAEYVPVVVATEALSVRGSLSVGIARAVRDGMGVSLKDRELEDLFDREPVPGVPWLIMVDGVDEVLTGITRRSALDAVSASWEEAKYRFLLTTRPLPDAELEPLHRAKVPTFHLQPFSEEQVSLFASSWFASLGLRDLDNAVRRFVSRLERTRLKEMARTPLIAALLCVVFAGDPSTCCQTTEPRRMRKAT
ncbi:MAG: trypsin-like peptidase domain-containing protein [Actinomycetota bacterium]|nr:trypsin-like peptidase domain-containing protein [Actinomycetota bacterium]